MFAVANKFVSVMATMFYGANSSMLAADSASNTDVVEFGQIVPNIGQHFAQAIYTFLYNIILTIGAFALSFIDFIQLIVYKFLGINYDLSGYKAYDPNNPLIKFITNDTVTIVLRSALSLALVFVIVFSIFSIIRGEYNKAANDQDYSVKRVWARALRAIVGMLIFPALFLGVIILTNAILSSFAYVLAGNTTTTMGNQVIAVSSYNANVYRNYANNNRRIPIYVDFEDPYDKGYADRYTTEELVQVYDVFVNEGRDIYNMFAEQSFPTFKDTYTLVNNSIVNNKDKYSSYEKFICTQEQYYVMAEFIDYALTNNVQFYYKPLTDVDIDWQYVDDAVFDRESKTLTITYEDALNQGETYTVSYKSSSYELTSPVQDAISSLETLLSLDGTKYKILDYMDGTINRVQWASNKVKIKLSPNYNRDTWTVSDQIILYEYYRYAYNNTFQNYTIQDLASEDGVYIDLYNIDLQFFRTYQNKYITLASFDAALINGTYYKVTPLLDEDQHVVVDEYGDVIYQLDTTAYPTTLPGSKVISDMSVYNKSKSDEEKIGVHVECRDNSRDGVDMEAWYSATYAETGEPIGATTDETGMYVVGNVFNKSIINTKGRKFEEAYTDEEGVVHNSKYGYVDANGFYKEVERVKATRSIKEVSWPSKLIGDLKAIYRDLNINQLITTGEWLETFVSKLDTNVTEFLVNPGTVDDGDIKTIITNLGTAVTSQILTPEMRANIINAGIQYHSSNNSYYFGEIDSTEFNNKVHNLYSKYNNCGITESQLKVAIAQNMNSSGYLRSTNLNSVIAALGSNFAVYKLFESFRDSFERNKTAIEDGQYYVLTKQAAYNVYEDIEYSYDDVDSQHQAIVVTNTLDFSQYGVTRTNWLDNLKASVPTKTQEYVASFDTSLISPQGLIFSEIFLGEIVESDGENLGNYMFKSKYSNEQLRSMMLALLGEEYYETATITINYFVDMFNQLFAPLLEKIMAGEGQPMTVGEVMNIQLYTYKAYLASVILSDDSARFMLDIARSFVDMYAFSYDILMADPNDNSFAVTLIREYADTSYGSDGINYMVTLEDLDINWKDYYSEEQTSGYAQTEFKKFLRDKFGLNNPAISVNSIKESDLPSTLVNAIQKAAAKIYHSYAEIVLSDNMRLFDYKSDNQYHKNNNEREDIQYGLVWQRDGHELDYYMNYYGLQYDEKTKYITDKNTGKIYHTWKQLNQKQAGLYDMLADAVYSISSADMDKTNSQTRFVQLVKHAENLLNSQRVFGEDTSYPEYLKVFKAYIFGSEYNSRQEIWMSEMVKIDRIEGIYNEYQDYEARLKDALENLESFKSSLAFSISFSWEEGLDLSFDLEGKMETFVTKYFNEIDQFVQEHEQDNLRIADWKIFDSKDQFWNWYLNYKDGIKNDKASYKAQSEKISDFARQIDKFYEWFFYGCENKEDKEARKNQDRDHKRWYKGLATIYNFSTIAQNMISNQNVVDSFHKYFLTYAVRMQATEKATKMFTVVVNNHAYDLAITMPTAKLVEYVIGGQWLQSLGFETMFTDIDYTGFLDIGYGQKLPKLGEPTTFGTINKFLNNLANITVDAYYASNLKNITDTNRDNSILSELHYAWSSIDNKAYVITGDSVETQPTYLQLILQNIFENQLLRDRFVSQEEWSVISKTSGLDSNDHGTVKVVFNRIMSYLLNSSSLYDGMTMKSIRLEMLDSLYNYQTYSSDSAEEDIQRYVTLFRLFCSDFEYTQKSANEISVEYRQNQASKAVMMRLSGLKDKPEELMVNLEYKSLYDDVGYDEQYGDYFILCSFDETRQCYYPILMTGGTSGNGKEKDVEQYYIHTDYYYCPSTKKTEYIYYPVIGKGVITADGYPTAIRQINGVTEFYRKNVIIRNASEMGLSAYYMSVEQVSVSMNIFQRFTNSISKLFTGKTLIEHAYSNRKMIKINSNFTFPMGVETETTKLTSEGISMHYYTMMLGFGFSGLPAGTFYETLKIDIVILILAILALIPMLLKAVWGVFGRVIDVTIYYLASPVMFSTIALGQDVKKAKGDGTQEDIHMFSTWREEIFKKTLSVFGYVFAFQMFFILVPFIYSTHFITDAAAYSSIRMFSWVSPSFIDMIIRVIFLICSVYLLTSAPKLFAEIMNQSNGFAEGDKVKAQVADTFKELQDTISGQKIVDSANYAREQMKQMIPGYEIAIAVQEKIQGTKAKVVGAVAQVAGTVMKFIPQTAAYADAVKKAGKEYKEKTLKRIEQKKALREEKKAEGQKYLDRYGLKNQMLSKEEESHLKAANGDKGVLKELRDQADNSIKKKKDNKRQAKYHRKAVKKEIKNRRKNIRKGKNSAKN